MTNEEVTCYDERDRALGLVHIPGCTACAVYDHDHCTCPDGPNAVADERRYRALVRLDGIRARRRAAALRSEGLAPFPADRPRRPVAGDVVGRPPTSIVRHLNRSPAALSEDAPA